MAESIEAANKRIAIAFLGALSRADRDAVAELYAEDFELWTAGTLPFSGDKNRAEALEAMNRILDMFPDGLAFTTVAMTAEGERVAIEAECDGIHTSGRPYHNYYHFLLVVRDGRIVRFKEYMDTALAGKVLLAAR